MHDFQTCPAGAHGYIGETGEETLMMKMQDDEVKMEMHAEFCGNSEKGKGRRERVGVGGGGKIFMVFYNWY